MGKKVQGIRSVTGRYKIDRGRLIVWEIKKPKNIFVQPIDMTKGGLLESGGSAGRRGKQREKKWDNYNSRINKIYLKNL